MSLTSSPPVGQHHRLRVVFMGTPDYGVPTLRGLIAAHDVVAVFTQPDRRAGRGRRMRLSPVKQVAVEHEIAVHQPATLRKDPDALEKLDACGADVVVVAAYGLILPPAALTAARHCAINVHASLLPRWRGAAPVSYAILAGDRTTGVTIMQMDPGLDTGPVLAARETAIGDNETAGELTERLSVLGGELLVEALPSVVDGTLVSAPQDDSKATMAPRLKSADGGLDWSDRADNLARRVRAMNPWPGAYALMPDGSRLKVHRATATEGTDQASSEPVEGEVTMADGAPAVVTRSGVLRLEEVQAPGRRAMPGGDFMRGRPSLEGVVLPDLPKGVGQ